MFAFAIIQYLEMICENLIPPSDQMCQFNVVVKDVMFSINYNMSLLLKFSFYPDKFPMKTLWIIDFLCIIKHKYQPFWIKKIVMLVIKRR
jgi:hypothetical protein